MKIGMMNDPARNVIDEITFAGENKFDFIDVTIEPPKAQIANIDGHQVLSLCKKYNLEIIGHTNFYMPWASAIQRLKDAAIQEFSEQFALFHKLGVTLVNLHSHWYQPNSSHEEIVERIVQSLQKLIIKAKQYDITLMLEHQPNGFLSTPESLLPILDRVEHLLFHLDVGHAQVAGHGKNLTNEFLKYFKDKLVHVHVSDNKGNNDDHLPIGAGIVDWEESIGLLKGVGYNGTITLEVFVKDKEYLLYSKNKMKHLWRNVAPRPLRS